MKKAWNISAGINSRDIKLKTRVFNADEKKLMGEFDSMHDAAKFIGITYSHLRGALKFKRIIKAKDNIFGANLAVR